MHLSKEELQQLDLLKKKSPAQRFFLMAQLIQGQIEAMKAGIKYRNPEMTEEELHKYLKEEMFKIYSINTK